MNTLKLELMTDTILFYLETAKSSALVFIEDEALTDRTKFFDCWTEGNTRSLRIGRLKAEYSQS